MVKFLHKFYNRHNIPWVNLIWSAYYRDSVPSLEDRVGSFWWKDLLSLNSCSKEIAACLPGGGSTFALWYDAWDGVSFKDRFPHAFSFARHKRITLGTFAQAPDPFDLFTLPLSELAFNEV